MTQRLKKSIEKKELQLKEAALSKKLSILESLDQFGQPSWGRPADPLPNRDRVVSFSQKDNRQDRAYTILTIQDLDRVRNRAKFLFEQNPNARGIITGLRSFVIGNGLSYKSQSKKENKNESLVNEVDDLLDDFAKANNLWQWYSESFTRSFNHGEMFLELSPTEEGVTQIRAIEPDFILTPHLEDQNDEWSWGILTDVRDTQTVRGYNVRFPSFVSDPNVEDIFIEPQFIHHLKLNVNLNVKRGLPSLLPCFVDLEGMERLRYVNIEGLKVRTSIAYIQQFINTEESVVQALANDAVTDSFSRFNSEGVERTVNVEQIEPGSVPRIPESLEFVSPPQSQEAEAAKQGIRSAAEACASRLVIPVWLVLGADEGSSYASSLTSESPFVKRTEFLQNIYTRYWQSVLTAVVNIGVEQGRLPENTLEKIEIQVTAPSVNVRNRKDENETYKLLSDEGILSKRTWSISNDLEWEKERANIDEEKELNLPSVEDFQRVDNQPETPSGQRNAETGEEKPLN